MGEGQGSGEGTKVKQKHCIKRQTPTSHQYEFTNLIKPQTTGSGCCFSCGNKICRSSYNPYSDTPAPADVVSDSDMTAPCIVKPLSCMFRCGRWQCWSSSAWRPSSQRHFRSSCSVSSMAVVYATRHQQTPFVEFAYWLKGRFWSNSIPRQYK